MPDQALLPADGGILCAVDRAVPPIEAGYDIHTVQELLGHKDVQTTMIYTHVMRQPGVGVISPLDTNATGPNSMCSNGPMAHEVPVRAD